MKRAAILISAALALAGCEQQPAGEPASRTELGEAVPSTQPLDPLPQVTSAPNSACQSASFEGVSLTHCIADPAEHRIAASLAPRSGENFGTIEAWAAGRNESAIAFVTNAGIYGDDLMPIGYFVSDSDRLVELNRADGEGNFFLKPSGVFFGSRGTWRILETDTFLRTIGTRPQFGTQSGPMLVINGELHPEIAENGPSRAIRNGVGVDADGKAHFVISNAPLSFGQFARFFRDELATPNALYLDGNISALWDPQSGRMDQGRVGPVLVVEKLDEQ